MIKILASSIPISVLAISLPLAIAAAPAAPFNASAAVAPGVTSVDVVAERIGGAFASLPKTSVERADAVILSPKGDRRRTSDCASATWPNIDTACLSTADGSPAPHVRTITIGYQTGQNATVLLRVPGAVAERSLRISRPVSFQ